MKTDIEDPMGPQGRFYIIASALLALFLGAMDALIMSAAAPTIIADLGGLHLYSWVYSAYFLARAVALPVFGKLSDMFNTRKLFLFAISLFLTASIAAGASRSMAFLVFSRVFQGIGAGACFALVYIVLSEVAPPGARAKTLSLASSVWGISSIIGPTLGGVIVTWFSWRWIFYINVPLGIVSLVGIGRYLTEFREKKQAVHLDYAGVVCLTGFILGFLSLFMTQKNTYGWGSLEMVLMFCATVAFGVGFFVAETRAKEPILDLKFFKNPGFALGNGATFFASCTIFALFAYAPLFIQGALSQTPMQVGVAMLSLSLGWSVGAVAIGRIMDQTGGGIISITGGVFMVAGAFLVLNFSLDTPMMEMFWVFMVVGLGMGFVSLSTMVQVQNSLPVTDLGVATASAQFARTLGGTIGVGVCGGLVTSGLLGRLEKVSADLPPALLDQLREGTENLFRPEVQAMIPDHARQGIQMAVLEGIHSVFVFVVISAVICLVCTVLLAKSLKSKNRTVKKSEQKHP